MISSSILEAVLSPNGDTVALLVGTPADLTLQCLHLESGEARTLHTSFRCSEPFMSVVWSPDGRALYYAADDGNWFHDLWCVQAEGDPHPNQLTDYFHTNTYPVAASPNGETLLVISNLRGELNLRTLDLSSLAMRKITDYATPVTAAVYSPDGSRIAYTANGTQNPYNSDIYIMNADGFSKRKVLSTLSGAYDVVRDWDANGRYLAVESNYEEGWQAGVFDLRVQKLRWYRYLPGNEGWAVRFSPDAAHLLVKTSTGYAVCFVEQRGPAYHELDEYPLQHALWLDTERLLLHTAEGERLIYTLADESYAPLPLS